MTHTRTCPRFIDESSLLCTCGANKVSDGSEKAAGAQALAVSGPCWVITLDDVENDQVIQQSFTTRDGMIDFHNRHPGNASYGFLAEGQTREIIPCRKANLKASYAAYAESLRNMGTSE